MFRKPLTWVALAVVAIAVGIAGYWFAPWKLLTSTTVDDALSTPAPALSTPAPALSTPAAAVAAPSASATSATSAASAAGPVVLGQGAFVSHEHDTTGSARIVRLADGSRTLEIVGLATSDGPDLRVWLSDQPVREGKAGWEVFDDGAHVELGRLKGNRGNQVYSIPASVDLTAYRSVSIWCIRFSVSFGAAPLA